jgi:Zn-dependent protease
MTFHLGKIPVRVLPSFFLVTLLFNLSSGPDVLAVWMGVVFVSVLIHELGHATVGVGFGLEPRIDLHGMGGTTSWAVTKTLSTGRRVAISLAGPTAGFAFAALAVLAWRSGALPRTHLGAMAYGDLLRVNLGWGVLNLLPMLPLDGGNVLALLLGAATKGRGERPAHVVSIVVALASAIAAMFTLGWWPALLAASFVASNWRGLQAIAAREHDAPMRPGLEEAYRALETKDGERILTLARPAALTSKTPQVRAEALQLMAFGFLLTDRLADADASIAALPKGFTPHPSLVELRERVQSELPRGAPPGPRGGEPQGAP